MKTYREKIIYEGGIYHITQRAPGREMLFLEENDYLTMLHLLKKYATHFKIDVFCFCLMPNHIHVLLRINKPNLSEAMKALFTAYAVRFNQKYQRKGHVFCGVYRASLCLDDIHFIGASLYIHMNPQKAGLSAAASRYRWSSVNLYIKHGSDGFIRSNIILEIIDDDVTRAMSAYKSMLRDSTTVKYENILENPNAVINFAKSIFMKVIKRLHHRNLKDHFITAEKSLDEMIETFRTKKYIRTPTDKKAITYLIAQLRSRGMNTTEIAKTLHMSRPTIYRIATKGKRRR